MNNFILVITLIVPVLSFAHGGGEEGVQSTKGVIEYSDDEGFKLSDQAYKRFKIELGSLSIKSDKMFSVPVSALVYALGEVNVYRVRDGHFKHVDVKVLKKDSVSAIIQAPSLKIEDKIVIKGADFLRVTEMDLGSGEEEGHHD